MRISIKQYEQAADATVSIGGIRWEKKWDVCIQCDSFEEADAIRVGLRAPENDFNPDWYAMVVMAEEQQRMAAEIETLKQCLFQAQEAAKRLAQHEPEHKQQGYMLITQQGACGGVFRFRHDAEVIARESGGRFSILPLYTAPPQREWVGLTDEELFEIWVKSPAETEDRFAFARAIEAKLREKNQ